MKLHDQLRRLMRESGVGCNALARATGVHKSAVSRFLSRERGLSAKGLDAIGDFLGWEVVQRGPKGS